MAPDQRGTKFRSDKECRPTFSQWSAGLTTTSQNLSAIVQDSDTKIVQVLKPVQPDEPKHVVCHNITV
uniref:MSP domain-containing protein n=1 Tax=Steinernema glaseri TaxID=37863 RepID=A0A1I7ZM39_9BILA